MQMRPAPLSSVTIGIPSYNESKRIINLLKAIEAQELPQNIFLDRVLVSDDSTDRTPVLVREFMEKTSLDVEMLHHERRRGTGQAWNEIFARTQSDFLVLYDADVVPYTQTTSLLLKPLVSEESMGLVASNPIPDDHHTVGGAASAFISSWLRMVRKHKEVSRFTVMGRGLAIRGLLAPAIRIPADVISIDLFVTCKVLELGYFIRYEDNALLRFKPPSSLRGLASQTLRGWLGHRQLRSKCQSRFRDDVSFAEQSRYAVSLATKDPRGAIAAMALFLAYPVMLPMVYEGAKSSIWEKAA